DNNIWISSRDKGIEKIDPNKNLFYAFTSEHGLVSDKVSALSIDENNNLWIGTGKGLQYLNLAKDSILTFVSENGLAANDIYEIGLHNDKVYAGSSKGFNILKKRKSSKTGDSFWDVKTIDVNQGLNYLDVAQGSMSFDNKNRLWAGVENQILTVIDEIKQDTTTSRTFITGINITDERKQFHTGSYLSNKRQGFDSIWNSNRESYIVIDDQERLEDQNNIEWNNLNGPYHIPDELTLPYNENYLSFSYSSLTYDNPGQVAYKYFLEGIDKAWSPVTYDNTSENYRDLPPGKYTFIVRFKGYNNIWSEPAEFSFSIIPPWWKTWWAYLLYALLAVLILYSIMHYRSKWLKKENRILEERVSERTAQLQKSIHDLENTQAQLIQSEKMASLGELTAGIAHEIQNPLNFVNNFSEVNSELIEELRQERLKDKQERDLELEDELLYDIGENEKKIRHHGQRADAIVKGMLQHSRNSSAEKELTDINKLADEYLRLSYHGLRAKDKSFNAAMKTEFDESLPKIYVAPQDIGRVILNLINNAFYAVSEKKKMLKDENYDPLVIVKTEKHGKFINIHIIDNGRGIPPEVQEKIFQPFFTTKPSGQGTGLGLSLSYDIIKSHGGIIKLKTRHGVPVTPNGNMDNMDEEGTTFTIQLPANLKKNNR
ncbi:MAG: ATP-binding protein, partial [Christiangramia sp.]|nr:ATP-binding protein [Christiangramia sp.]